MGIEKKITNWKQDPRNVIIYKKNINYKRQNISDIWLFKFKVTAEI
jgi:hypothetical protein